MPWSTIMLVFLSGVGLSIADNGRKSNRRYLSIYTTVWANFIGHTMTFNVGQNWRRVMGWLSNYQRSALMPNYNNNRPSKAHAWLPITSNYKVLLYLPPFGGKFRCSIMAQIAAQCAAFPPNGMFSYIFHCYVIRKGSFGGTHTFCGWG